MTNQIAAILTQLDPLEEVLERAAGGGCQATSGVLAHLVVNVCWTATAVQFQLVPVLGEVAMEMGRST